MKSLLQILTSLIIDFERLEPGVKGLHRDLLTMKARIEAEGYGFATIALPSFGKALDKGLHEGRFAPLHGFSRARGLSLPKFLLGLTSKIFDAVSGEILEHPDVHAVKMLRELTYVFRKLALDSSQVEKLDTEAKRKFFSLDKSISITLSDANRYYLDRVSSFVLKNLDDFSLLNCKHGRGAVDEKLTSNQKWLAVSRGIESFDPLLHFAGYDLESFLKFDPMSEDSASSSCNFVRLVTVPKNSRSRRTITVEPTLKQYVQQGLNDHLRKEILKCSVLRNCIALSDQAKNQILAEIGSRDGSYATLDLSSASDLLSLDLVKIVFSKHPRFLSGLILSRTEVVQDSPDLLRKYAGMGNATTFPVQSVCFAILSIASILEHRRIRPTFRNIVAVARNIQVYGDDIIVKTEYYTPVVEWLHLSGLSVNQDKSYFRGSFRESCGLDAFKGYTVTPVYIKALPDETSIEAKTVENLVSASNLFWERGLYKTSTTIVDLVEKAVRNRLPLVRKDSGILGLHTRRDAFDFQRWNRTLHRREVFCLTSRVPKRRDNLDGHGALLKSFLTPLIGRDSEHLRETSKRYSKRKYRLRWVHAG